MKQILTFILFSAILCWALFSPIYRHVAVLQQSLLQNEVDFLLEVGANSSHGYISETMMAESRLRLAERGFVPEQIIYDVSTHSGVSGTNRFAPVLRGDSLILEISYPYGNLFTIDRIMGISTPAELGFFRAKGIRMSEFVPPNTIE